jgi:hypothetical protein
MRTLFFLSALLLVAAIQPAQADQALAGARSSELSLEWSAPLAGTSGADTSVRKSPARAQPKSK